MDNIQHIILDDTLSRVVEPQFSGYICHAYCHGGSSTFTRNGNEHRMEAGDCLIIPRRACQVDQDGKTVQNQYLLTKTIQPNLGARID